MYTFPENDSYKVKNEIQIAKIQKYKLKLRLKSSSRRKCKKIILLFRNYTRLPWKKDTRQNCISKRNYIRCKNRFFFILFQTKM